MYIECRAGSDARVIADKLPLTLDKNGAGKVTLDKIPAGKQPRELLLEATFADPNGELQTIRHVSTLWPAAVVAGIKTEGLTFSTAVSRSTSRAVRVVNQMSTSAGSRPAARAPPW